MAQPVPTGVTYAHHLISVSGTENPQQATLTQIDVRKVVSWSFQLRSATGPTFDVLLRINGDVKTYLVPAEGANGTGWILTKQDSLANGG
jgi:hypothetical protein